MCLGPRTPGWQHLDCRCACSSLVRDSGPVWIDSLEAQESSPQPLLTSSGAALYGLLAKACCCDGASVLWSQCGQSDPERWLSSCRCAEQPKRQGHQTEECSLPVAGPATAKVQHQPEPTCENRVEQSLVSRASEPRAFVIVELPVLSLVQPLSVRARIWMMANQGQTKEPLRGLSKGATPRAECPHPLGQPPVSGNMCLEQLQHSSPGSRRERTNREEPTRVGTPVHPMCTTASRKGVDESG